MVTYSDFENKYPLSKKKFWKKILQILPQTVSQLVGLLVLVIFVVVYSAPKSPTGVPITSTFGFWITPIAILLVIVIFAIRVIYIHYYIKYYFYDCNEQFITIKKDPITPKEIHVQYSKIQDVYVDQDLWDRILNIFDVHIASATVSSGIEAHIDGVDQAVAEEIKNLLLNKIKSPTVTMTQSTGNTSTDTPTNNAQTNNSNDAPIELNKKISSKEYPISSNYLLSTAFTYIITAFFMAIFFASGFITSISAMLVVFATAFFISFGLLIFYQYFWIKAFYFEFDQDYILCKTGVLSKKETHIPYKNIQNVTTTQGLLARIFHIKNIVVENAAQGLIAPMVLLGQPEDKATEITDVLNDLLRKINRTSGSTNGL